jgi:hypothetical protein
VGGDVSADLQSHQISCRLKINAHDPKMTFGELIKAHIQTLRCIRQK